MTSTKSKHIQILRGLAIIAVVLIHTAPIGIYQVFLRPFLNFCVGSFLFLSGMLSNAEKWDPKKRIIKVMIPYVIWTAVYVVIVNINDPAAMPFAFVKGLLTARSASMMYYIFVYCAFALLIPLIDRLARSKYSYFGFIIAPLEIIAVRMIPKMAGITVNEYVGAVIDISFLCWFTYFYLGYMMGNKLLRVKASTSLLTVLLAVSVIIQIGEGYLWYLAGDGDCGSQLKLSSLLTGAIFVMLEYRFINAEKTYNAKLLEFLGDHSFGIYFSHIAVLILLKKLPFFSRIFFPLNAVAVILLDVIALVLLKKLFGKHSRYIGL